MSVGGARPATDLYPPADFSMQTLDAYQFSRNLEHINRKGFLKDKSYRLESYSALTSQSLAFNIYFFPL